MKEPSTKTQFMTSYDMETLDSLIKIWAFSKHENFKADKENILVAINSLQIAGLGGGHPVVPGALL